MIKAENLEKKFDEFVAVDNLSLKVGEGELLALLGPNGAGKTTTVRMLSSILKANIWQCICQWFLTLWHNRLMCVVLLVC